MWERWDGVSRRRLLYYILSYVFAEFESEEEIKKVNAYTQI